MSPTLSARPFERPASLIYRPMIADTHWPVGSYGRGVDLCKVSKLPRQAFNAMTSDTLTGRGSLKAAAESATACADEPCLEALDLVERNWAVLFLCHDQRPSEQPSSGVRVWVWSMESQHRRIVLSGLLRCPLAGKNPMPF